MGLYSDLNDVLTPYANAIKGAITKIGTLANLTTNEKTNLVGAVNEVKADLGDLSELETETKTDIVSAINEAAQSGGSVEIGVSGTTLVINTELVDVNEEEY